MRASSTNFTALDIGSSKISILAADLRGDGEARIGYQGLFRSSGIKVGQMKDYDQAEHSIVSAIYNLENDIQQNISEISISLSGVGVKSMYIYKKIKITDGRVTNADVKLLNSKAVETFNDTTHTVIHYFPIEYTLDQNHSINNPIGMFGNILGCKMHVVTSDTSQIANILNCFSKCHINVKDILVGAYASGLATLTEDEKNLGSVIIDLGGDTTSLAIFSNGSLLFTKFIPIGGNHITSDIAKILSIGIKNAEKLKVMYGSALKSNIDTDTVININDLIGANANDDEIRITSNDLSAIIAARVEEIVEVIKSEYDNTCLDHLVGRRIVLTGGGSQLRGVKEIVAGNFNKQVRIGQPLNIPGFEQDYGSQSFAACLGVIKHEMSKYKQQSAFAKTSKNIMNKITSWLRDPI
ncbi:MAG: cell division protein FtsA [Rickettsiaceae bacterium]|nr:cell division protein FtsA [Rickettsiaceae bacterium]